MTSSADGLRMDLWLKYACLFKHRNQATEACQGGKVRLNDNRAKASSIVRVGDVIEIQREHLLRLVVLVTPKGQASRKDAASLYRNASPPPDLDTTARPRLARIPPRDQGAGRPTKRERRELVKLKGGE